METNHQTMLSSFPSPLNYENGGNMAKKGVKT